MKAQRDTFISDLYELAKTDKNIILISVDMGAPSLDIWRETLPNQFIAAGISEQNAINVAAGLANAGKKVYVYFMAAWVARCFEQIRYSCSIFLFSLSWFQLLICKAIKIPITTRIISPIAYLKYFALLFSISKFWRIFLKNFIIGYCLVIMKHNGLGLKAGGH